MRTTTAKANRHEPATLGMGGAIYAIPFYLCVVVVEINNEVFTMTLIAFLLSTVILERRKPFSGISWSVLPLAVVCAAVELAVFPVML